MGIDRNVMGRYGKARRLGRLDVLCISSDEELDFCETALVADGAVGRGGVARELVERDGGLVDAVGGFIVVVGGGEGVVSGVDIGGRGGGYVVAGGSGHGFEGFWNEG